MLRTRILVVGDDPDLRGILQVTTEAAVRWVFLTERPI